MNPKGGGMGVFSYLSLKRPAAFIWRTFSPTRDNNNDEDDKEEHPEEDEHIHGRDRSVVKDGVEVGRVGPGEKAAQDSFRRDQSDQVAAEIVTAAADQMLLRKISDGSTSSGVSDMSGGCSEDSFNSQTPSNSSSSAGGGGGRSFYLSPPSTTGLGQQPPGSLSPRSLGFGSVGRREDNVVDGGQLGPPRKIEGTHVKL